MEHLGGLSQIRNKYHQLSGKQKKVADFILENSEQSSLMTMRELSKACETSEATIVRFLQKLDYESYQVFRIDVTRECSASSYAAQEAQLADGYQGITPKDSSEEIKKKVIYGAVQSIRDTENLVDAGEIRQAAQILCQAGQILCYGSGGSLAIAQDAYHKLLRMGLPVFCEANYHLARIKANALKEKDAAILISHTGESQDLLAIGRQAQKHGAIVIGITSYLASSLAQEADLTFYSSHTDLEYYTDAMTSRLAQLTILDMIYLMARQELGEKGMDQINKAKEAIAELKTPKRSKK